jgi:hypothetical protein
MSYLSIHQIPNWIIQLSFKANACHVLIATHIYVLLLQNIGGYGGACEDLTW